MTQEGGAIIPSYGRRHGRKLRPRQRQLLDAMLPRHAIALPEAGVLDIAALFPDKKDIWLEIGFGAGEHLAALALRHPEDGFIGCEVYVNGVAGLLDKIEQCNLSNIRLFTEDARRLMAALPENGLAGVYLLFPDPWPKARHRKRRIVSDEFLLEAARIVRSGGLLLLASDHADYAGWMLEHVLACPRLEWTAERAADWRDPPPGWTSTRYEAKTSAEGRRPTYIACRVRE